MLPFDSLLVEFCKKALNSRVKNILLYEFPCTNRIRSGIDSSGKNLAFCRPGVFFVPCELGVSLLSPTFGVALILLVVDEGDCFT